MTSLTFCGATGTVTGSRFLLEHHGFRMLVDCGLFQGLKQLRERNWSAPPFAPAELDLVVLTHAHLDHTGYFPRLARLGYDGPVLATSATCSLCGILWPDSGHLQEEDARFANKRGFSKHKPALPLYTEEEARIALDRIRPRVFGSTLRVHDEIEIRFHPAGHILGAAFVEVRIDVGRGKTRTVLFSGDLGRPRQPILPDPTRLPPADVLLLESTYGNRDHPADDPKDRLAAVIRETTEAGGTVLIPAFAVGRTTHLLYLLRSLQRENRLPTDIPIHVDSPMAIDAIRTLVEHDEAHDPEMRALVANGDDPLGLRHVRLAATVEQSKALNDLRYPAVIISASGMATGGRVLHHLAYRLGEHRTTVLFVGYQAAGTRGRSLQDGAKTVRIHGREVRVRARVETVDGLSAHADRSEIMSWLGAAERAPGRVYLVHGEPPASRALAERIRGTTSLEVHEPSYLQRVEI
ncbi:MAG TPA: MBL fold metallo-hydrolase [Candidatus Polarisedimenticolaceae bacterium]|nr:MBL fold metallo-hydrolase [Candidatus Polarisedimenticolaceae bacterium]